MTLVHNTVQIYRYLLLQTVTDCNFTEQFVLQLQLRLLLQINERDLFMLTATASAATADLNRDSRHGYID